MENLEHKVENNEYKVKNSDNLLMETSWATNSDLWEESASILKETVNQIEDRFDKLPKEMKLKELKSYVDIASKDPKKFFDSKEYKHFFSKLWKNWDILDDFSKRQLSIAVFKYIDNSDEKGKVFDVKYNRNETIFIEPNKHKEGFSIINAKVFLNEKDVTDRLTITPWTK